MVVAVLVALELRKNAAVKYLENARINVAGMALVELDLQVQQVLVERQLNLYLNWTLNNQFIAIFATRYCKTLSSPHLAGFATSI